MFLSTAMRKLENLRICCAVVLLGSGKRRQQGRFPASFSKHGSRAWRFSAPLWDARPTCPSKAIWMGGDYWLRTVWGNKKQPESEPQFFGDSSSKAFIWPIRKIKHLISSTARWQGANRDSRKTLLPFYHCWVCRGSVSHTDRYFSLAHCKSSPTLSERPNKLPWSVFQSDTGTLAGYFCLVILHFWILIPRPSFERTGLQNHLWVKGQVTRL